MPYFQGIGSVRITESITYKNILLPIWLIQAPKNGLKSSIFGPVSAKFALKTRPEAVFPAAEAYRPASVARCDPNRRICLSEPYGV